MRFSCPPVLSATRPRSDWATNGHSWPRVIAAAASTLARSIGGRASVRGDEVVEDLAEALAEEAERPLSPERAGASRAVFRRFRLRFSFLWRTGQKVRLCGEFLRADAGSRTRDLRLQRPGGRAAARHCQVTAHGGHDTPPPRETLGQIPRRAVMTSHLPLTKLHLHAGGSDSGRPWEPRGNTDQIMGVNEIGLRDAESGPMRVVFNPSPPPVTPLGAAPEPAVAGSNPAARAPVSLHGRRLAGGASPARRPSLDPPFGGVDADSRAG